MADDAVPSVRWGGARPSGDPLSVLRGQSANDSHPHSRGQRCVHTPRDGGRRTAPPGAPCGSRWCSFPPRAHLREALSHCQSARTRGQRGSLSGGGPSARTIGGREAARRRSRTRRRSRGSRAKYDWHAASSTRVCAACSTLARPRGGITSRWNTSTVRRSPRFVTNWPVAGGEGARRRAAVLCRP